MIEKEIIIPGEYSLSGTLTLPSSESKKFPGVFMIVGTGRVDRDGNLKILKTDKYNTLATELAKLGYASLRYDKRGIGKSEGDYYQTGLQDVIEDAVRALCYFKSLDAIDENRTIILGHSEGALIAPAVVEQEKSNGLILLCGSALPGDELIATIKEKFINDVENTKGVTGFFLKLFNLRKHIETAENKAMTTPESSIRIYGIKFNAKWLREFSNYNVREHLKQIDCPTLIINGGKDILMDINEADAIAQHIAATTTIVKIPTMNHILRDYSGTHHFVSLMQEYRRSGKNNVSNEMVRALSKWLRENS